MKKNNLILLVLLPGLIIGLVVLLIWPTAKNLRQDKQIVVQSRQAMSELLARGQNVDKNQKNLELIEGNLHLLDEAYLKKGEELNFITDLEQAAAANNVEQAIDFNNELGEEKNSIKTIPLELKINGDLKEIMAYINALERLPYYVDIARIDFSSGNPRELRQASTQAYQEEAGAETNTQNIISAKLNGATYWK
ncbi:MAG TPA: type 4a pilus biogenesis protein PilO [bacterium]|nr:type 4a pilus biogenesis protein PilO [bacterium]